MLQLTKKTEYGLIALTHLAQRAGSVSSVREICERYPVPRRLVAEVLKDLCHARLVESHRGSSGGYSLARPPEEISVGDVVGALEGHPSLTSCASLGLYVAHACEVESVCPIRSPIETLRIELWRLLTRTTLRDLASHPLPLQHAGSAPRRSEPLRLGTSRP
jgi:Rrf2 family protein